MHSADQISNNRHCYDALILPLSPAGVSLTILTKGASSVAAEPMFLRNDCQSDKSLCLVRPGHQWTLNLRAASSIIDMLHWRRLCCLARFCLHTQTSADGPHPG